MQWASGRKHPQAGDSTLSGSTALGSPGPRGARPDTAGSPQPPASSLRASHPYWYHGLHAAHNNVTPKSVFPIACHRGICCCRYPCHPPTLETPSRPTTTEGLLQKHRFLFSEKNRVSSTYRHHGTRYKMLNSFPVTSKGPQKTHVPRAIKMHLSSFC